MIRQFKTRDEILSMIPELSPEALAALTEAGIIQPLLAEGEPRFREIDAARLQLAVELEEMFRLDPEALALVPEIRNIVSLVVGEFLPQIKGSSAYDLVSLVLAVLVQQYVSPRLPAVLRPYLTAQAIRSAINGLQWAYDNWVKPRLKK